MSDKPLAYASTIKALDPIPDKDRIVLATFEEHNWRVITEKGKFKPGDLCVYIETDSILPIKDHFKFLEKRCFSTKYNGYRIKTMRMGGVYSEGIVFAFEDIGLKPIKSSDLTKAIGIRRIEEDVLIVRKNQGKDRLVNWFWRFLYKYFGYTKNRHGFFVGDFPGYCQKTDETQAQSIPNLFEEMQERKVYATVKMDGMSTTFALHDGIFTVSSRNKMLYREKIEKARKELNPQTAPKYFDGQPQIYVAALHDIANKIEPETAIQGECCGPKIQGNKMGLNVPELYVFSKFSIERQRYYAWEHVEKLDLPKVPFIRTLVFEFKNIQELEKFAEAQTYQNKTPAEGVVFRAWCPNAEFMPPPKRGMCAMESFKIINPKFKLKYQD